MSNIVKTSGVVIRKIDYGDTSKIVTLFTENLGKVQGIIKGARSPKSKIGKSADLLNQVDIVLYEKQSREIQLISQADLVNGFSRLKSSFDSLKYATAIAELFNSLLVDNDEHPRLYSGLIRILNLMNSPDSNFKFLFAKFFLFFINEIGYEPNIAVCSGCGKPNNEFIAPAFNFETGIYCDDCKKNNISSFNFSKELFQTLLCLNRKNNNQLVGESEVDKAIIFLEKYISYQIPEFKGLNSLQNL